MEREFATSAATNRLAMLHLSDAGKSAPGGLEIKPHHPAHTAPD